MLSLICLHLEKLDVLANLFTFFEFNFLGFWGNFVYNFKKLNVFVVFVDLFTFFQRLSFSLILFTFFIQRFWGFWLTLFTFFFLSVSPVLFSYLENSKFALILFTFLRIWLQFRKIANFVYNYRWRKQWNCEYRTKCCVQFSITKSRMESWQSSNHYPECQQILRIRNNGLGQVHHDSSARKHVSV